jgi:hypothetical protein
MSYAKLLKPRLLGGVPLLLAPIGAAFRCVAQWMARFVSRRFMTGTGRIRAVSDSTPGLAQPNFA